MTWAWLKWGNLKRETESLSIAAQNYAITTNYIKAKIGITHNNSKCKLCRDKDEMLNHRMSAYGNLTQKGHYTWMGRIGDPTGIVQDVKIRPHS